MLITMKEHVTMVDSLACCQLLGSTDGSVVQQIYQLGTG